MFLHKIQCSRMQSEGTDDGNKKGKGYSTFTAHSREIYAEM